MITDVTKIKKNSRISIDPNICFGKPCIRGHRISVSLIIDLLTAGEIMKTILEEYPGLEKEDILACFAYGAEMAGDCVVDSSIGVHAV